MAGVFSFEELMKFCLLLTIMLKVYLLMCATARAHPNTTEAACTELCAYSHSYFQRFWQFTSCALAWLKQDWMLLYWVQVPIMLTLQTLLFAAPSYQACTFRTRPMPAGGGSVALRLSLSKSMRMFLPWLKASQINYNNVWLHSMASHLWVVLWQWPQSQQMPVLEQNRSLKMHLIKHSTAFFYRCRHVATDENINDISDPWPSASKILEDCTISESHLKNLIPCWVIL